MSGQIHPQSILSRIIALVPDPRSRRGRIYPLAAILGMLLLGALEGEGSLRGMWMRGKKHWRALMAMLGTEGIPDPPGLTTVWYVLQRVDTERLEQALRPWVAEEEALCMDGKYLRGSRREGERALQVLAIVGQRSGQVLMQQEVHGDEAAAAVELLGKIPLEGKVVSVDAGLMEQKVVKEIEKRGATILAC